MTRCICADWIKKELPEHGEDADALIDNSPVLAASADIAIGSKHAECTRTIRTPEGPAEVSQKGTTLAPAPAWLSTTGAPPPPDYPTVGTEQISFKITAGAHGEYDALDLAAQAVKEWEVWLRKRLLL